MPIATWQRHAGKMGLLYEGLDALQLQQLRKRCSFTIREFGKKNISVIDLSDTVSGGGIWVPRLTPRLPFTKVVQARNWENRSALDEDRCKTTFELDSKLNQIQMCQMTLDSLQNTGGGILNLRTGGGKTVCAIHMITVLRKKTCILVHNTRLMQQWIERLGTLAPDLRCVALKGRGFSKITQQQLHEDVDVAVLMLQSLRTKSGDQWQYLYDGLFPTVVVDECHHIASPTYADCLQRFDCEFTLGLSATWDKRSDGLGQMVSFLLGSVCKPQEGPQFPNSTAHLYTYESTARAKRPREGPNELAQWITAVSRDQLRTELMVEMVVNLDTKVDEKILVFTGRREHALDIAHRLRSRGISAIACLPNNNKVVDDFKEFRAIVATPQFLGEGFDLPGIGDIVLATPFGDIRQLIGRGLRFHSTTCCVHDIVDVNLPLPHRLAMGRQRQYRNLFMQLHYTELGLRREPAEAFPYNLD